MCLILVVWRVHPDFPWIVAANRDEFHHRPAAAARWWADEPAILAGRDLLAGGTWLGVNSAGAFAALTNFRGAPPRPPPTPSRGELVANLLGRRESVDEELHTLDRIAPRYSGFNLLFSDGDRLGVYESERAAGRALTPGIYGLSNHLLDTAWPKVRKAKSRLAAALEDLPRTQRILDLLRDEEPAADEELPRTGVSLEWERLLSSAFIRSAEYGTRCSTLITRSRTGTIDFREWTWDRAGAPAGHVTWRFDADR